MIKESKKALVLLNMGGARNKAELEMFLTNMFNDKNILTIKSDFFRSLLAKFIVYRRKDEAWENYELIGNQSPINPLTEKLVEKLDNNLKDVHVYQAMRYTPPRAKECIEELKKQGIKDVILLPLYPQYSTTTTKSSVEEFVEEAKDLFSIEVIDPFYENKAFNSVIVKSIKDEIKGEKDFNLIFSAHGLPQKVVDNGDPYEKHVNEHVKILSKLLEEENCEFESISLAYQSKVGPMKWLEPSLDDSIKNFRDKKVLIYPISFIVDNSETDFELAIEYKEIADEMSVQDYKVCRCPNDSDEFIQAIKDITKLK